MTMTRPDLDGLDAALAQWALRRLGFDRRALRFERLRAAAEREAGRLGWPALEQALRGELPDSGLDAALVAAATVGETYFFRQQEHFDLLKQLPFRGSLSQPLRAWSAACASGEEAYSLAVALRDAQGLEAPALEVWGTDINEEALAAARAASYGRWSFRASALEVGSADQAFEAARAEAIRAQVLDPRTRAVVRFARQSLLEAPAFDQLSGPRFHVIFCRNALVYFHPDAASQALKHLVDALLPGGWLILGNMDVAGTPPGTKRHGSAHLCVFEREQGGPQASPLRRPDPISPAPTIGAILAAAQEEAPVPEAKKLSWEESVDWHRAILAQVEAGEDEAALLELQALIEARPDYLPGWFEHGLALNRRGQRHLAAVSFQKVLSLSRGYAVTADVEGPEPLSLDFYVGSAEAFLESLGDAK